MNEIKEKEDVIYEADSNEVYDLIPVETDEAEEAGMSPGLVFALGALGGALILKLGEKAYEGGKKLITKCKAKKAEAAAAKEAVEEPEAPAEEAVVSEEA